MDVHTIRLRAPWQISDRAGDLPTTPSGGEPLRLLPQAQGQAAERATLVRQFNCPTHLGQARVRLKLDIDAATVRATLNGKPLTVPSHDTPWRIDVTEHLRLHNQLEIAVDATSRLPHRWDVALEIIQPTSSRDGP